MGVPESNKRQRTEGIEQDIKQKIRSHLGNTLPECIIPEFGEVKKGKVRDIYFHNKNVVMVTNDRVSAFDFILPNLIPFKGQVLNMIAEWVFGQTADIVPNALISSVDNSVVVQRQMKNLNVEFIIRGYLWGSMAASYEKGERSFCGLPVPDGLLRYQKFDTPLYTPTTKAEVGHDENMTSEEVEKLLGPKLAAEARDIAMKLYQRGVEIYKKKGLILIDTKYEFGTDENGKLFLIDEVNTPDSSRLIDTVEWEAKYPKVAEEMKKGQYKDVSALLKAQPALKMKEFSKQYVRDALLATGFDASTAKEAPKLTEDQVVECAYRYISIFERVTGDKFPFPDERIRPETRILSNLRTAGLLTGGCVIIMAGSDSDIPHLQNIRKELQKFKIPSQIRICSAHKQPAALENVLQYYNKSIEPLMIVGCAGGTDALSGTASYSSMHPVVSCPPDGMNQTCLTNPPGSSNAFICKPANVAKFAAQLFSHSCPSVAEPLVESIKEKVEKLEKADAKVSMQVC